MGNDDKVHNTVFLLLCVNGQVDDMLEADLRRCRQVSIEEIDNKPVWFPLAMAVAKLFSPVL